MIGFRVIGNDVTQKMVIQTILKAAAILMTALTVFGCNKPGPVELQGDDTDALLEVTSIAPADSDLAFWSIDSSATLPSEQIRFAGQVQITHATFDAGVAGYGSIAFTRLLFEDRAVPVHGPLGRIIGYYGMDLGPIALNGTLILRLPHRITGRIGRPDTTSGTEYVRDVAAMYQPGARYTWRTVSDSVSITTPDDIVVESPQGGTVVRRDRDLAMSWRGEGRVFVVISRLELGRARPLFMVRMKDNRHRAILPRKAAIEFLPPGTYVFTFVRANRKENESVSGFSGAVLIQAASVYNSYVELR